MNFEDEKNPILAMFTARNQKNELKIYIRRFVKEFENRFEAMRGLIFVESSDERKGILRDVIEGEREGKRSREYEAK